MTSPSTTTPPAPREAPAGEPGMFGNALLKLVSQSADVASVRALSARLRLVTLRSPAFRTRVAVPGDKLQLRVAGMSFRTFTPLRLTGDADAIDVVGYLHGGATPAGKWLADARAGNACHVLGPRRSMDLGAIRSSTVFFGDETTIGLAAALCTLPLGGLDTHFVLEVDDAEDTRRALGALAALGLERLRQVQLVERRADGAHLDEIEEVLARHAGADAFRHFVLGGHARSIQRFVRALRRAGVAPSRMLSKAYWAPGKAGLD